MPPKFRVSQEVLEAVRLIGDAYPGARFLHADQDRVRVRLGEDEFVVS